MKKTVLGLLLILGAWNPSAFAENHFYVGGKAGTTLFSKRTYLDNGPSYGLQGGWFFAQQFAIEGEYGTFKGTDNEGLYGFSTALDGSFFGIYVAGFWDFSELFYAKCKFGYMQERYTYEFTDNYFGYSDRFSETLSGMSGGLGFGVKLNPDINLETEWVTIDRDVSLITLGVHYHT